MSSKDETTGGDHQGATLGRKAGRLFKRSGPELKRLVQEHRPKVEKAGRDALKYAREHEDEIRALALKGVRMRAGPLGMVVDALNRPQEAPASEESVCPSCQAINAKAAKFCNQCGTKLVADSA